MKEQNKGLSRRQFLKGSAISLGILSFAASLPAMLLSNRRVNAQSNEDENTETPEKIREWCMVIDLRKCEGCVTIDSPPQCTQSCITGHYVPKGQQWIQVFEVELPSGSYFLPSLCNQCENAPCVNVCPVGATYHDKDGVVLIDHKRCIGCRMCMAACPYQRRFFNWGEPDLPPEAAFAEYSPIYPVPAVKGTVIKCMFCAHFLRNGVLPYCVTGCPMKALYVGDLNEDIASNGQEVVQLSRFISENDGFRLKEELGTQPRVWYLPGHGQVFERTANDPRPFIPTEWPWESEGYDKKIGLWPWGEKE